MSPVDSTRKFQYREPRLKIGFNVDFATGGALFPGFCRDVSNAGIRGEFEGPIVVGSEGLLILRPPAGVLELQARVAYVDKRQVGLLFLFGTPWERTSTLEFIAEITQGAGANPVV
jgi:PilZ domain